MAMRRTFQTLTLALLLALAPQVAEAMKLIVSHGVVKGMIYDSSTGKGISGLVVKLLPPRPSGNTQRITVTNARGEFQFGSQRKGRYMLEVRQGLTLLYRRVIDTNMDDSLAVSFRRKAG
jgi:hypothetical protein